MTWYHIPGEKTLQIIGLYFVPTLQSAVYILYTVCIVHSAFCTNKYSWHQYSKLAQHPSLCIQFLNRENNDKNNTFPLGFDLDLFYNSTGLCGNLTPQNTSVGVNTTFLFFFALILFPFVKIMISLLSYLLVYKSTFYDQKFSPKNHLRLIHESYTKTWPKQSRKLVWSPLGKPSL